ncbi:UNVERIFIED_CONTAM: hypothetical protein GTU68_063858, partial [Idotea baltica]|nr:hypothetical protein [Idotea baltica]
MKKKFFNTNSNAALDLIVEKPVIYKSLINETSLLSLADSSLHNINYALATELNILVTKGSDDSLNIYCQNDKDIELVNKLKFLLGHSNFELNELSESELNLAIYRAYNKSSKKIEKFSKIFNLENEDQKTDDFNSVRNARSDSAKFLCALIDYAHARKVSDIHIIPERDGFSLRLRKNGEFLVHENSFAPLSVHKKIVQRIKTLSNLDISNSFLPQDGSFNINIVKATHSLRVSTMPTIFGERVVLRLFPETTCKTIDSIGFSLDAQNLLNEVLNLDGGLILTSGSTGSGKTTTLYSLVLACVKAGKHVVTLEDPVEIEIPGVIQSEINYKKNFDYATGFKAILRQDPDVILIGEIRDAKTAQIAVEASETGHIILSTVHGRNLDDVQSRFLRYNVAKQLFESRLALLISQKLLPKLCDNCK